MKKTKSKFGNQLIRALGGKEYQKKAFEYYPAIDKIYDSGTGEYREFIRDTFSANPDRVLGNMSMAYVTGWSNFSSLIGSITDPEFDFNDHSKDYTETKAYELYSIMEDFYGGYQYYPQENGVPMIMVRPGDS